ncbi:fatty acid synthase S-acetyltransferase [Aspergillus candidus]|uniref:Fatty acid synthase S-acetyltransferase n=1 Tax=Aspergillus candidus TaxID=41067 RepID=A0A2I2F7B2_ASPCN|nr:fatty acid synthase S-acetyltransferase [Aspergillus candidus]PLB36519.1 fatty acid synthase S-acetyltransferase [Aspergillus candidus]
MAASEREPIAVVGIGCRFPGGVSTAMEFWEALQQGIDAIGDIPKDRFDSSSFHDKDPQKYGTIRNCKGGFLDDIKSFDADFFGYFPAEASRIDPQQRLALEASVHALQDSGTPLEKVAGSRTSVFLGTFMYDHLSIQTATEQRDNISPHVALGSMIWATANRVSHRLNLQGPSITLDTACSSSLSALHLACQSIWTGESEGALAGGVNAILRPEATIMLSKSGFLSPDGTCKPFDASANGYVRSEGVGIVYLKPLKTAIQDKDRIYACIRGSLVNQDGYTADGFTVPSLAAQATLLETVYTQSNIDPTKVQYIEAHGPGTLVGDPVEANALGKQLGQKRSDKQESLWIGSVKGNYGHLEGAAGIIGFIKASLVAFYGEIPPQANNTTLNPSIDFKSLRLAISRKKIRLPRNQGQKIFAGVNSFGAGGANAHVILEEAPNDIGTGAGKSHRRPRVFNLSARSHTALAHTARDLASVLRLRKHSLEDVAYTLNMRRDKHAEFSVIPAQGLHELCSRLDQVGSQQTSKNILTLQKQPGISCPKVAFVFSGQGGQWLGMGMRLAYQEPTFREHLAAFDNIFASLAQFSIIEEIFGQPDDSKLSKTTIAQPAIAAIQIALARTLISYGIKPEGCVGHSIGEIAAAHICGALSLEDAVNVIYFRSQIQSKAAGAGSMLATGLSAKEADSLIQRLHAGVGVEIAALNGPKTTTLTGDIESLEHVARELERRDVFARFVKVDTPYHSRFMDALEGEIMEALSPIQGTQTEINLHLSATDRMIEDVLLSVYLLPGMLRGNDVEPISRVIGATHAVGIAHYWFEDPEAQQSRVADLTDDEHGVLRLQLSTGVSPFLSDHVVNGSIRIWLEDLRFELPVIISRRANAPPTAAWHVCSREAEALDSMNTDAFYQGLEESGFRYGEAFRCLFSFVELPPSLVEETSRFTFHPALLDACVHTVYAYQHHVGNPHNITNDYPLTSVFAHIRVYQLDDLLQTKTLTQLKEHRREEADFENVLILDPPGSLLDWLLPTVQSAFPRSRIYEKASEWGFNLDRRTLLVVPALLPGGFYTQCNPFSSSVEAATRVMVNEFPHPTELQTLRFVPVDVEKEEKLNLRSLPARGGRQHYKDVLNAMGSLSNRATSDEIGKNVNDIDRGALVMARVSNGISACVLVRESILIHSGAGGHVGARVYATAGSPARRAWVSDMGAEAVFDSRSLTFHDEIKLATQGRGVDIVLNCLPGAMFSQSMACLSPFGRFLEIGKTEIYRNTKLGLEKLGQNCAFFAVDIDRLAAQKPNLHRQIVGEVCKLLGHGILLSMALKRLSRSSVMGKAAVEMPSGVSIEAMPPKHLKLDGTRSYLITGGTSGLGLQLAKLLVERGAKHLVLVSRTGPKTPEDHALILNLRYKGVSVYIETGDISNIEAAESLFHQHKSWPSIAGVIHSAGVLGTISAHDVTPDSFRTVFAPKALGAWNLHQTTQGLNLDFFVLVSSVSSILGVAGQLSYAAANQFLDGLAQHRQASGLPGTSLNLGVLGEYAGMSRTSQSNNRVVQLAESEGLSTTDLPTVFSALERALLHSTSQTMISSIDWSMFLKAYPHLAYDGAYLGLDKQQEADKNDESQVFSSRLSGPEREQAIRDTLQAGLAKILGVDTSRISPTEKIDQYSLDSMTLTQLRGLILREFRTPYPLIRLFEGPSLQEVAAELNGTSHDTQSADKDSTNIGNDQLGPMSDDGLIKISPWFVRGSSVNAHCPRLLCVHSMGAAATLFASVLSNPPDGLDPIAMQLPGRATRSDEPPASSIPEVVSGTLSDMENVVGYPAIIWGHSFGGIIAFEMIRALRHQGKPLPQLLVTGTIAPSLISIWQKRDILVEVVREDISPDYWMSVARYVDDVDYLRSIMPLMRQDGPLLLKYQFHEEAPLNIPITAFTARQDDLVYVEEISAWKKETKNFRLVEVDGDHWFLYRNRVLLRETLTAMACDIGKSDLEN